jgi:hypothetical protein
MFVPRGAWRYTRRMREVMVSTLILLCGLPALSQTTPAGWKTIKDAKGVCRIDVPPEWVPLGEGNGAAVFRDPTTAIAVVTSQPAQEFKPLTPQFLKSMGLPKEKIFENSATRIFYQDRTSEGRDDPNEFSSSVPANGGTCSCHLRLLPGIPVDLARKIVLSLSAVVSKT